VIRYATRFAGLQVFTLELFRRPTGVDHQKIVGGRLLDDAGGVTYFDAVTGDNASAVQRQKMPVVNPTATQIVCRPERIEESLCGETVKTRQ